MSERGFGANEDWPGLMAALEDALHLPPQLRTEYLEDVRWLFQTRLWDWLSAQGLPVRRQRVSVLRINQGRALRFAGVPLRYACSSGQGEAQIDGEFCLGYGFDDYSFRAINYRHTRRNGYSPADFVGDGPLSLGSFAVVLQRPPMAEAPAALPGALRCCGYAEAALNKAWSVQAWLGVWVDARAVPDAVAARIGARSELVGPPQMPPPGFYDQSLVMQYFGKPGDDEVELRARLGFAPKGKPVSEEILYRSVCEIFGAGAVRRRYRGRELQGLELDVWLPSLRLGIEYQGEQHERRVIHWHGEDGLEHQQQRDKRKKALCKKLGYKLLYFYPGDELDRAGVVRKLRKELVLPCDERREPNGSTRPSISPSTPGF